jgi:hypothetical protein
VAELQEGGADQLHAAIARGQELLHQFQVFQLGVCADLFWGGWGPSGYAGSMIDRMLAVVATLLSPASVIS